MARVRSGFALLVSPRSFVHSRCLVAWERARGEYDHEVAAGVAAFSFSVFFRRILFRVHLAARGVTLVGGAWQVARKLSDDIGSRARGVTQTSRYLPYEGRVYDGAVRPVPSPLPYPASTRNASHRGSGAVSLLLKLFPIAVTNTRSFDGTLAVVRARRVDDRREPGTSSNPLKNVETCPRRSLSVDADHRPTRYSAIRPEGNAAPRNVDGVYWRRR